MAEKEKEKTPMRRQYEEIKSRYPDCMLLFRLGDFYEMFDEDAQTASDELELTLTTRDRNKPPEEQVPMCGVPYHAANSYIKRLIDRGHKVAVCDQLEDPALTKGLVKRDVIRVITPGTLTDEGMLDFERPNYICALWLEGGRGGAASCEVSTGEFCAADFPEAAEEHIINELGSFAPNEAILSAGAQESRRVTDFLASKLSCMSQREDGLFEPGAAEALLLRRFGCADVRELGLDGCEGAVRAAGALLAYISDAQRCDMKHISRLDVIEGSSCMELDYVTRRSLELTETMRYGDKNGSLLGMLDFTKTPMGGRMLRSWVERPLLSLPEIVRRHAAVQELFSDNLRRAELIRAMSGMGDMQRILARVSNSTAGARDLNVLMRACERVPDILGLLDGFSSALLRRAAGMDSLADVCSDIKNALLDKPNISLTEGNLLREGYAPKVDHLREIRDRGSEYLAKLEAAERERTGIKRLKIGYNRVFGYYFDVPRAAAASLPEDFIRKQTLVSSERFVTTQLKELETEITTASEQICRLEYAYFCDLRQSVGERAARIQDTAEKLALVDTLCSLAEAAVRRNYCRPEMDLSGAIDIRDGRHPVVEQTQKDTLFVPNDARLDRADERVLIITGPNMAGKSTYMRQTALIVLMAQMGSFVPARSATIGIVDRVFTRIGASDDLSAGQSTFMVEMSEVAGILRHATSRSLILLDEIGRGTSTYDGMAIARAVLEYCADKRRLGAKTLFSTHYHELTDLEGSVPGVRNYYITARKQGGSLIFLRKVVRGAADDSYGIEVAKLAGVPDSVIERAKKCLAQLLAGGASLAAPAPAPAREEAQLSLGDAAGQEALDRLRAASLDTMSPIEAMNLLYELKRKLEG